MTIPARVIQAVRPQASSGVLAGASVVAAVFAATPFLLPDISARLDLPLGSTGWLSTTQVGSFALASFLAGRLLTPRRRYHYAALLLVAMSTFVSALAPNLPILLASRLAGGLGLGTLTWVAWADATRFARGIGDVAAVGPITAAVASPAFGFLTELGGYHAVYAALAVIALLAMVLPVDFGDLPKIGRRVSGSRSNRVLLAALLLLTAGGSGVFIFSGAAARDLAAMTPGAIAWAFSLNALAGVLATRFQAGPGRAGLWLAGTAAAALATGFISSSVAFYLVMAWWGLAFWMGIPAVFRLLAQRSLEPRERVGDAQSLMALGRVAGPLIGGAAVGASDYVRLSLAGALLIAVAATTVALVERARAHTAHTGRRIG